MKIVMFYHSLLSDWNHGNAHFLRGVATELIGRGNKVKIYEPKNGWSLSNLIQDYGQKAVDQFYDYYPSLKTTFYNPTTIDLDKVLKDADLVIVHEWNDHELVKAIGKKKRKRGFRLLFHDTHHRAVTEKESMSKYDLSRYDGVITFGKLITDIYLDEGWATRAWTIHEAADTRIFKPKKRKKKEGDFVWIGNWGDEERTKELIQFIIEPVKELKLKAKIYGVRYPKHALKALKDAGIQYGGWLPNYKAPEVFAKYRFTAHVPRGPYVKSLPGIPTIRPFEAMSCGIPLISSPWNDMENLFTTGSDYISVKNKAQMIKAMEQVMNNEERTSEMIRNGLSTISNKHTCSHRVDQLYEICEELDVPNFVKETIA